eukprot:TRINITY_DN1664_c0_g1_i1.p1 TRINITY_DN1664_c0_g1~~TRINITY_DN1664_c0_g1_i1.p1  ORF type:complete len:501 (+),score=106.97 TRINITY_DN1664_c0_g1_i1:192-1505(+)
MGEVWPMEMAMEPSNWWIPTGFTALSVCSAVFVSGISEETAIREDASGAAFPCTVEVDYAERSVVAFITQAPQQAYKAIWREGLGCTLIGGGVTEAEVRAQNTGNQAPLPPLNASAPWPLGEGAVAEIPAGVDAACIRAVMDEEFGNQLWNVRAMTIVYDGQLIYERYAPGITPQMPLLGWSMTKSIASALFGLLWDKGYVQLEDQIAAPEWAPSDPKQNITYDMVLRMSSGILWTESYHLILCLYKFVDCASWYAELPLIHDIDTKFFYSTGQTFLISRAIHGLADRYEPEYNHFEWIKRRLFDQIDVRSGLIEHMAMGYMGAGAYAYLTPRDWARFGHLYHRGGDWFGRRVLSDTWTQLSCQDSPTAPGQYARKWWREENQVAPDICSAYGFRKQKIFNMFEKKLTITRNAMPQLSISWLWDEGVFLDKITQCFP